ncbi:Transposon Tf2-9 polyprotein, partial [Dictyocoela roeselum]
MHEASQWRQDRKKSINIFSTSFIVNYILFNKPVDEYLILSSKRYREQISNELKADEIRNRQIIKVDERFEVVQFEYVSSKSGLKMTHRLNLLISIEEQDLLNWKNCFNEVARVCNWSDDVKVEVLTQIVDLGIQVKIGTCTHSADIIYKILKLKYNTNTVQKYQNRLSKLRQEEFPTTRAYINEININCQKVGLCLDWSDAMIQSKIEEVFFSGLHERVKFDLVKHANRSFQHCLQTLIDMDYLCIEKIKAILECSYSPRFLKSIQKENSNARSDRYKSNYVSRFNQRDNQKYKRNTKYCELHKSNTHSNEECRARKHNDSSTEERKSYAVREPPVQPRVIEIPIRIKDTEIKAMIDTGSADNFISEKFADEHNIEKLTLDCEKMVEIANGSTMQIKKFSELEFQIQNDKHITYKSSFLLLSNPNCIMILGMKFLMENDAQVNLKDGIINLDGREYEIDLKTNCRNEADDNILNKTKIFTMKNNEVDEKELIEHAKRQNPLLGNIKIVKHKIELLKDFTNKFKEYPVPIGIQPEVVNHLKELMQQGIIEEKSCDAVSPAFVIKKKNGKLRLVVDYRYLNSITKKVHNITPNIYEILAKLKGAAVFSTIDLNNGYYQISVNDEDVDKTGFSIMKRTYVFRRMPFGLCNAPATFQTAMNMIFNDTENVLVYMDDILVYTSTLDQHKWILKKVFGKLQENNVSINFDKSKLFKREIEFLGHRIDKNGITPAISKLESYENFRPKSKKQLQRLLGFINWFRAFVPNLSILTAEMYEKLKIKGNNVRWTENDEIRLSKIMNLIKEKNILHHPDINREFLLRCDASDLGIGSMLFQDNKILGYYSKKFNIQEANYTVLEKEIYAILKSLDHFKPLIYNTRVNIETDNKNLTFNGELSKRAYRWKLLIEEYDYTLRHIEGKENFHADVLSRYMLKISSHIPFKSKLIYLPIKYKQGKYENNQIKIAENDINEHKNLIKKLHEDMTHPGIVVMEKTLKKYLNLKGLRKLITEICNSCLICIKEKEGMSKYGIPNFNDDKLDLNEVLAIDIKGPIPSSHFNIHEAEREFYVIAAVDLFSRYCELGVVFDINSETICTKIEKIWLKKHPAPKTCLTDNGRQFTSNNFKNLMKKYGIKHVTSAPYNPTGNGVVERINKEIGIVLRLSRGSNVKELKDKIWIRLNCTFNRNTGYPPYEIYYKRPIFKNINVNVNINKDKILDKLKLQRRSYKKYLEKNRIPVKYVVGDMILIKNNAQDKMKSKWIGPFNVTRVSQSGNNIYVETKNKIMRVSVKNCRPYKRGEDVVSEEETTLTDECDEKTIGVNDKVE